MIGRALLKRLSLIGDLRPGDVSAIRQLSGEVRTVSKSTDLLVTGAVPKVAVVVLDGFLCRYTLRSSGARQVQGFYIPTDAPFLETLHLDYLDSSLATIAQSVVGLVSHMEIARLVERRPGLSALVWRESLIQAAAAREWLSRNSILSGPEAMAHLFCELFVRSRAAGHASESSCAMPATQEVLGQALGLTAVHVNRTLQLLRQDGLVDLRRGRLHIHDLAGLTRLAGFDPHYLHLRGDRPGPPLV